MWTVALSWRQSGRSVALTFHPHLNALQPYLCSCGILQGNLYLCMIEKIKLSKFYWHMLRIIVSKRNLECATPIKQLHLRSDYQLYKRGYELHPQPAGRRQNANNTERTVNTTTCHVTWQTYYRVSVVSCICTKQHSRFVPAGAEFHAVKFPCLGRE